MKISQAIYVLQQILKDSGDLDLVFMEGNGEGFASCDLDLIAEIGLPDEQGNEEVVCAFFDPDLAEELKDEVALLDQPYLRLLPRNEDEN